MNERSNKMDEPNVTFLLLHLKNLSKTMGWLLDALLTFENYCITFILIWKYVYCFVYHRVVFTHAHQHSCVVGVFSSSFFLSFILFFVASLLFVRWPGAEVSKQQTLPQRIYHDWVHFKCENILLLPVLIMFIIINFIFTNW